MLVGVSTAVFISGCGLLLAAGIGKLRRPLPAVNMLRATGIPVGRAGVRAVALLECVAACVALGRPTRPAIAVVGVAYAAFGAFAVFVRFTRGGRVSCGCFGQSEIRLGAVHAGVNFVVAAAAVVSFVADRTVTPWADDEGLAVALTYAIGVAALTLLLFHALVSLPNALSAYRSPLQREGT